jgi:hypothetical protein
VLFDIRPILLRYKSEDRELNVICIGLIGVALVAAAIFLVAEEQVLEAIAP